MKKKYIIVESLPDRQLLSSDYFNSSTDWWRGKRAGCKSEGYKVSFRSEIVNGVSQVYYALINYPNGKVEEYFLLNSLKNDKILKSLGVKRWFS